MSEALPARVLDWLEDHGAKALRYCGTSVVNVLVGQGALLFCLVVLGWAAVPSNLTAWALSTIPAYLLSRHWVWQQDAGNHGLSSEILPFWILALVGLGFSTFVVWLVSRSTDLPIVITLASLAAYGVVWVVKYLVLDKLLWSEAEPALEAV